MTAKVGVTRQRLLAALAFFAVATVILAIAGVEMKPYLTGVVVGIAIVAAVAWLATRRTRDNGA